MPFHDLRSLGTHTAIDADLCLVGAGPAAWTIAHELGDAGLRIVVLESGGLERSDEMAELNEIDSQRFRSGRERMIGGSSATWTGRCRPFDAIDFERRDWVPNSGWPFGRDAVAPYLDRAAAHLGVGPFDALGNGPVPAAFPERPAVDPAELVDVCWEDSTPIRFGPRFLEAARRREDLVLVAHATVTHVTTDPSGARVESVEVAADAASRTTVTARAFVLCAGGIENARLLLASDRIRPHGVGNEYDLVGRYLMDHPRDKRIAVAFDPRHAARVWRTFGPERLSRPRGRYDVVYGYALSEERQRRDGLLHAAAWPDALHADDDPVDAMQRLASRSSDDTARDVRRAVARPLAVARALRARAADRRVRHAVKKIGFVIGSEQVPDPQNRVRLTARRDRLGMPVAAVDWRTAQLETVTQAVLARTIAREAARVGLPRVALDPWAGDDRYGDAILEDGYHPTGTTRMSDDPRTGVVDAAGEVHGVAGLYVAGSSTFPTAGHANPTLMIVALAIRLAETLRARLRDGRPAAEISSAR